MKKRNDGRYQKKLTINGKQIFFYGRTQKEVNEKILNYKEKEEVGKTFKEVVEEWEDARKDEISYGTKKRYRACIERAIERFGNSYIKEISVSEIDLFIRNFASTGVASKTVKMQRSVINLIFKYAILKEYVTANPCQYVPIPKNLSTTKRELPNDDEIKKVKESVDCTFGLFAYLILYTGLRRGEALALTYEDIDFENKTIRINKSLYHNGNKPVIKEPKTSAGIRNVILVDCLADKINKNGTGYIFTNERGELIHSSNFNRLWKKYKLESGVSITPHQLRHAYATILYDAGIADKDAQELLGHTDITLTRNIYTHISSTRIEQTKNKLNAFIKK